MVADRLGTRGSRFGELTAGLSAAEHLANTPLADPIGAALRAVFTRAGTDPVRAAAELNRLLTALGARPALRQRPDGIWVLVHEPAAPSTGADLDAVLAVAMLVAQGGWNRLKHCRWPRCPRVFADRTNGGNRAGCVEHRRKRPG
jgi:predicted RNA-binding Zn ribbon-like protein